MTALARQQQGKPRFTGGSVARLSADRSASGATHAAARVLGVQHALGNQAMQRLLRSGAIQAKLTVSQPGDPFEQEADRIAEGVLRMPEPRTSERTPVTAAPPESRLQRICDECEEELHRQPMEEEEEEETLQAEAAPGRTPAVTPDVEAQVAGLQGGGQPLPESVRAFFEPRFGYDFNQVRIHTDAWTAATARAVNARAYTFGRDIVFGAGQYSPGTAAAQRLLAHELTHVVQQRARGAIALQRACRESEGPPAEEPDPEGKGPHPLIYRGVTSRRSRRPAVGDAQQLLNGFLEQLRTGKFKCMPGANMDGIQRIRKTLTQDPLEVDCRFGPNTEKATCMFQRCVFPREDLAERERAFPLPCPLAGTDWDGMIGPKTWKELVRLRAAAPEPFIPKLPQPELPKEPPGPKVPEGSPSGFCQPITPKALAQVEHARVKAIMMTFTEKFGSDVQDLWRTYLDTPKTGTKGTLPPRRRFGDQKSRVVKEFREDPETLKQRDRIIKLIADRVQTDPKLMPPEGKTTEFLPFRTVLADKDILDLPMSFKDPANRIPGLIAGGFGKDASDAGDDVRHVDGQFRVTNQGLDTIRVQVAYTFAIFDAVDFCPGAPGGQFAQFITVPLSRLEATPDIPTYDTPFEVIVGASDDRVF